MGTNRIDQYGDFQTPLPLATEICTMLKRLGIMPQSIVEPTCGSGSFVLAAASIFSDCNRIVANDINPDHISRLESTLDRQITQPRIDTHTGDFFLLDWTRILKELPQPILILGNPPWVTNSDIGRSDGLNLPKKINVHDHRGIEALTGKGNFDISESILLKALGWFQNRDVSLAMLCKTSVARKVLAFAWRHRITLAHTSLYRISAIRHFGVAVDACFLIIQSSPKFGPSICRVYPELSSQQPSHSIGFKSDSLVANMELYKRSFQFRGRERCKWRSGVKHDCANVMEITQKDGGYINGFGQDVIVDNKFLYPLLKSSDLAANPVRNPRKWLIVPQQSINHDLVDLADRSPVTWAYLASHAELLDRRRSSIYRNRPRFSIFGVGPYTFSPWKVAISGFYKRLEFRVVGPWQDKPVVFDDTVYFLSCQDRDEAEYIASLLNSMRAKEFYESFVFWDSKRPITVDVLKRLDLLLLAQELGTEDRLIEYLARTPERWTPSRNSSICGVRQGLLFGPL